MENAVLHRKIDTLEVSIEALLKTAFVVEDSATMRGIIVSSLENLTDIVRLK